MAKSSRFIVIIVILACSFSLFTESGVAATHYLDFVAGADTNNGTAKGTPWKHAPGMTGCSRNCSSYTPAAGDRFIFKGGVTWDYTSFATTLSSSGLSGNPIYYGVDTTWYTGTNSGTVNTNGTSVFWLSGNAFQVNGSWTGGSIIINRTAYTISSVVSPYFLTLTSSAGTQSAAGYSNSLFVRPKFNGGGVTPEIVSINGSYITMDSIEITGQMANSSTAHNIDVVATNGNVLLENMDIHGWQRCTGNGSPTSLCTSAMTDNSNTASGIYAAMYSGLSPNGMEILNSNIGGDVETDSGGIRGWQILINNHIHDVSQGCLHGCSLVHDNRMNNIGNTFDSNEHTNGLYADCFDQQCAGKLATATAYIYNNYITNMWSNAAATAIYPNPGTAGVSNSVTYYVFNNIVSGTGVNIADEIDPYNGGGTTLNVYDWNNTYVVGSAGTCVNVVSRAGVAMNIVDVRNLHCISTSGGTAFNADGTTHPFSSNLLSQSVAVANAQGYTAANGWAPTSGSGATVGAGTILTPNCSGTLANLCIDTTAGDTRARNSRSSTGAWDIGAYQFAANPPAPPTGLTTTVH